MKRILVPGLLVALCFAGCGNVDVDKNKIAGVWQVKETVSQNESTPVEFYQIQEFFPDQTMRINDEPRIPYRIEGNKIIGVLSDGKKTEIEEIVAFDGKTMLVKDSPRSHTLQRLENITHFKTAIVGTWEVAKVYQSGKISTAEGSPYQDETVLTFGADGRYWYQKDGTKKGPFSYAIDGAFANIDFGLSEKGWIEIYTIDGKTMERNLLSYKPYLRLIYERVSE